MSRFSTLNKIFIAASICLISSCSRIADNRQFSLWDLSQKNGGVFFCDTVGGPDDEVCYLSGGNTFLIKSANGPDAKVITSFEIGKGLFPVFCADLDLDGKKDIFFGSNGAERPCAEVRNGCGAIIARYYPSKELTGVSGFIPGLFTGDSLYCMVLPNWVDQPRGIAKYDAKSGKKIWFFHTPALPIGLCVQRDKNGSEVLIINHKTLTSGMWRYIGTDKQFIADGDIDAGFIAIRADGSLASFYKLTNAAGGNPVRGEIYFSAADDSFGSELSVNVIDPNKGRYSFSFIPEIN